jgi:hypothetical protein
MNKSSAFNMVKNRMLLGKITEYFSKNSDRNSVVLKANLGGRNIFWRAIRESTNQFRIVEVSTSTTSFLFEVETGKQKAIKEASAEFSQISKAYMAAMDSPDQAAKSQAVKQIYQLAPKVKDPKEIEQTSAILDDLSAQTDKTTNPSSFGSPAAAQAGKPPVHKFPPPPARKFPPPPARKEAKLAENSQQFKTCSSEFLAAMTPPFDHAKLSLALKKVNSLIGQITDPVERDQAGIMMGELTNLVDKTTAGGGSKFNTPPPKKPGGTGGPAGTGGLNSGRTRSGRRLSEADAGDKPAKKKEPEDDEPEDVSLDSPDDDAPEAQKQKPTDVRDTKPPEAEDPDQDPSQKILSQRLAGQTIRNAVIHLKGEGGELELELAGTKIPAKLSWDNSGKVQFVFKNRPYLLRR